MSSVIGRLIGTHLRLSSYSCSKQQFSTNFNRCLLLIFDRAAKTRDAAGLPPPSMSNVIYSASVYLHLNACELSLLKSIP